MPLSGLAITLSSDPAAARAAVEALASHEAITLGEPAGQRLPIVVDTPTSERDREVWQWLQEMPGVLMVDVAYVHFADDAEHAVGGEQQISEGSRR